VGRRLRRLHRRHCQTDRPAAGADVREQRTRLPGTWTTVDDTSVGITTSWGQRLDIPRQDLASLQFRNGRLMSLSDLTPANVEQTPYFDRLLPWQVDRSLDGKPLLLSDGPIARGLAVHARTALTYSLAGGFRAVPQPRRISAAGRPAGRCGRARDRRRPHAVRKETTRAERSRRSTSP